MAYTLRYSLGNIIIEDGSSDSANSSLFFPGKNYTGYGQGVDQNFLSLLENFASSNSSGPADAIPGQLWYNPGGNALSINTSNTTTPQWTTIQVEGSNVTSSSIFVTDIFPYDGNVESPVRLNGIFSLPNTSNLSGSLWPNNGTAVSNTQVSFMTATGLGGSANFTYTNSDSSTQRLSVAVEYGLPTPNVGTLPNGIHSTYLYLDNEANIRGNIVSGGWANIGGELVANSANIGGLTISSNGTISGGTLGNVTVSGLNLGAGNANLIVYTDGSGDVVTNVNLEFDGTNLIFGGTSAQIANITAGVGATGNLVGSWTVDDFEVSNTLTSTDITSGSNSTPGTLTGTWSLENDSELTGNWRFVTGNTNIANTVTTTIIANYYGNGTPDPTANGTIHGNWTVNGNLSFPSSANLSANLVAPSPNGYLYGNWIAVNSFTIANTANFITRTISSGSDTTGGDITGNWTLTGNSRLQATYADLAERYRADKIYEAGTVVDLGGTHEITVSLEPASNRVFGVISNTYGYLLNGSAGSDDTHPAVALSGRVSVKAVGIIKKGDRLISAGGGYAKSATADEIKSDNVIGRALEDKDTQDAGNILAVVQINAR